MKKIKVGILALILFLFSIPVFGSEVQEVKVKSLPEGIRIEWENISGVKKNIVVKSENSNPRNSEEGITVYEGTENFFIDKNVEKGKTYYYTVFSVKEDTYLERVENVINTTVEVYEKIPVSAKAGTISAGVGSQILWVSTVFDSFKDFWITLIRISQALVAFLAMKRRGKWGLVYDWKTKEPVKNIALQILNDKKEKIDSVITDDAGRFGFLVGKGKYIVTTAGSKDYEFKPDEYEEKDIYGDVYKGQELVVEKENLLKLNVPLVYKGEEKKEVHKPKWYSPTKIKSVKIINGLLELSFLVGFVFIVFSVIKNPGALNMGILAFYVFTVLIRIYMYKLAKDWGLVVFGENQSPLAFAVIRAFRGPEFSKEQVGVAVTNTKGGFYLIVPPETKEISIKGRDMEGNNFTKEVGVHAKKGVLNDTYKV